MATPLAFLKPAPTSWVATNLGNQCIGGEVLFRQDAGTDHSLLTANNVSGFLMQCGPGDFFPPETDRMRGEVQGTNKLTYGTRYYARDYIWQKNQGPTSDLASNVVWQLHPTENPGSVSGFPTLEAEAFNETLWIYSATSPDAVVGSFYPRTLRAGPVPFSSERPHLFYTEFVLDYAGGGALIVKLDGVTLCNLTNISIGFNTLVGDYIKFGTYFRFNNPANYYASDLWMQAAHYGPILPTTNDISSLAGIPPRIFT